jgi:hypothetical protein|nr:MAG TPA: hypothetical protein [Caudoviricetes sp.]
MDIDLRFFGEESNSGKIVVSHLAFKVDVTNSSRPYYSLMWQPVNSDETYDGYGSDNPFFVKEWKEKYFLVKNTGVKND